MDNTDPTRPTPPPAPPAALVLPGGWQIEGLPDIVRRAGPQAAERTVEFFTAQIRNPHTRAAYAAAVTRFFTWCDARGLALTQISPIAVATYIEEMQRGYRAPTIKQHLAAIRRLFDWLVTGQVMPTNPATSVRGPTHVVRTGKTPVLQPAEARLLLDTIDTATLLRNPQTSCIQQLEHGAVTMAQWFIGIRPMQQASTSSSVSVVGSERPILGISMSAVGSVFLRPSRMM